MKNKAIFPVVKPAELNSSKALRVSGNFFDLVEEIKTSTGLTNVQVTEIICDFVSENMEILDEDGDM